MSEHDPLEVDLSGLEWPTPAPVSSDIAAQLVASIQNEFVTSVVTELVASVNSLTERVEEDQERQDKLTELVASVMADAKEDRAALTAALHKLATSLESQPEPVVNVNVPESQVTVNVPEAPTPVVNVAPADVHVTLPSSSKTVTVKRDPLSGLISSADVVEV